MGKYIRIFVLLIALCIAVAIPVTASTASRMESNCVISADGSCRVELTLSLELDEAMDSYTFPIPASATDVRLGGTPARTIAQEDKLLVQLEVGGGSYTATIAYTLPMVVLLEGETGTVTLPLLNGFAYPVEHMEFRITLPGALQEAPVLTSGYYQEHIASMLTISTEDKVVSGVFHTPLKDHETLQLRLTLDRAAFEEMERFQIHITPWEWAILATLVVAVCYYVVTLMPKITRRTHCYGQPDGVTAGELGTCLTACGTDMTLLVISWAQMGYVTIEIDREDHVTLYKRMEMGNERSKLEMRCFQDLFHHRSQVDGTGQHYASIARKMTGKSTLLRQLYLPQSGSPMLFRGLMLIPCILLGIKMGMALGGGAGSQTVLAILLALFSGAVCWFIQGGGKCLPLRDKTPLAISLGCCGLWLVPGIATGNGLLTILLLLAQFIAGVAAAYGGKRSELGHRSLAQIRGLQHYLRTARTPELQQRMLKNGDYFYEMAPYALALGLDRCFARHFGKMLLPENSYLNVGTDRAMTAKQWAAELRYAADILYRAQKRKRM